LESEKESAGVVVGVATEVVNSGERFPALNDVIVLPLKASQVHGGKEVMEHIFSVLELML